MRNLNEAIEESYNFFNSPGKAIATGTAAGAGLAGAYAYHKNPELVKKTWGHIKDDAQQFGSHVKEVGHDMLSGAKDLYHNIVG